MIDYTAAGFTLLQSICIAGRSGILMSSVTNGKIIAVASNIPSDVTELHRYHLDGQILCPGFIDQHVHLIGGGGEAGPRRARRKWR